MEPRFHVKNRSNRSFLTQQPLLLTKQPSLAEAEILKIRCKTKMADSSASPSEGGFTGRREFLRLSSRTGKCSQPVRTPWLSRRHTPYVKTPKTSKTKPPEKQTKHVFHDIVGKTLRVYQASPLFKFDASRLTLRTYANQLSACMQLETEKQLVGTSGEIKDRKYKTDICSFKDVSANDAKYSAVKITVEGFNPKPRQANSTSNHILTAMFCSVGTDDSEDLKLQDHFTSLPICLIKAPVELARIMIFWFERKFDCRITPMTFSSMDLGWYFSLWAGISPHGKSVPIELCYNASSVKGLSRILFSIEQKDAKTIWENIHGSNSQVFTEEESRTFLKALECHFYHHFRINLEGLTITRVGTAIASVASEGKLKIVHPHYVDHVLEQLTKAASKISLMQF